MVNKRIVLEVLIDTNHFDVKFFREALTKIEDLNMKLLKENHAILDSGIFTEDYEKEYLEEE